jgi:nucleotide-binding universal stress UspA family protein
MEDTMIKRILVDLSDTHRAQGIVGHATSLAQRHQAEMTVVGSPLREPTGTKKMQSMGAAWWARELNRQGRIDAEVAISQTAETLRERCQSQGIPLSVVHEDRDEGFPAMVNRYRFHDLLVCGTSPRLDDASLAPSGEELLRLVDVGVRPILAVPGEFRPIRSALVAVSRALDAARALKQFIHLGLCQDVSVEIACANSEEDPAALLADAARYCRRHGLEVGQQVLAGTLSQELLPHAVEAEADLVVIGHTDHGRLARWFFGGTMMEIIRESDRCLFLS